MVDVLQAVHLLLALDLFVVVVGVDPRWLLHSLREQYRTAFRSAGEDGTTADADLGDQDAVWRTTPHDYLEKIFNIPFVLPGMTTKSFDRLIRKLSLGEQEKQDAGSRSEDGDDGREPSGRPTVHATDSAETPTAADSGSPVVRHEGPVGDAEMTDEGGSEVRTGRPPEGPVPRLLTEEELTLLASLGPLVRSPRQAKRLLNLYRMVRSTRDLSPASAFLGSSTVPGEYQAVGVLLGLLTAHPRLLGRILAAEPTETLPGGISHRDETDSWSQVVAGLRPRPTGEQWQNDVCADMSESDRLAVDGAGGAGGPLDGTRDAAGPHRVPLLGSAAGPLLLRAVPLAVTEEPLRAPVSA